MQLTVLDNVWIDKGELATADINRHLTNIDKEKGKNSSYSATECIKL